VMAQTREFRRLNSTVNGTCSLETRAGCQDDGHPVGAVHPYWFGHNQPGSFCHCGRIVYRGVLAVVHWPRPERRRRERPVFG
jgi:hypothetical protein